MKPVGLISFGVLVFLFGTVVPTYAQNEQNEQNGIPPPLWIKKPHDRGHQGPPQRQEARDPQGHQQPAPRPPQQENLGREGGQRSVWQEHRAHNWQSEHRTWQDRGGYNGYRIPEARYRGHFGPRHAFRLRRYPVGVIGGFLSFQYGGFGFSVVDPWPEYWSDNWYYNDEVYIDYSGDGYYLYNRRYPQDRVAITVNIR